MARKGKKKRRVAPPMVMKESDMSYRRRLLERWNYTCIVCGHEFANLACVTKEHVIPRAFRDQVDVLLEETGSNIAPSHYSCNQLRGSDSIFVANWLIKERRAVLGDVNFFLWLNRPVPNRVVPREATQPLRSTKAETTEVTLRIAVTLPLRSFELPETLPGMFDPMP